MLNLIRTSSLKAYDGCKRLISRSTAVCQKFEFDVNKFNDIHIKANHIQNFNDSIKSDPALFESSLKESLDNWRIEKRSSVWLYLPINLSHLAAISAKYGFQYHHAEKDQAVLFKWLPSDCESKIPMFASHQVGVAGVAYRQDTNQLLMIQDRMMVKQMWKFPGGAANLGENIEETAVREVFEETGVESKFASVIGFRQQHNYPGGHGRSDLYIVCRLEPLSYEINACKDEIKACEWIDLESMCNYKENKLTQLMAKSIKYGITHGFDSIDIRPKQMSSVFPGRSYRYFYRNINEDQ